MALPTAVRRGASWIARIVWFLARLQAYVLVASWCNLHSMWSFTYEPLGNACQWKPLEANRTGMSVLVYGLAKTGTTTMSRALDDVGLKAYHSEDFTFHVWGPLHDMYWRRPENGAKIWAMDRLATTSEPALRGHSLMPNMDFAADLHVLKDLRSEDLAAAISRCRADAMVFDGIEQLFWPVYDLSPGAKVIVLNWRTFSEIRKSGKYFGPQLWWALYGLALLVLGMHFLPWNAIVLPVLDPLFGSPITRQMREGLPFHAGVESDPWEPMLVCIWRMQCTERKTLAHWYSGFRGSASDEYEYHKYWEAVERVPKEDRFEWNMKKHGYKDLCKFLNITGNPLCERPGPLHKSGINVLNHEREQPLLNKIVVPSYYMFLHWIDFKIFNWVLASAFGLLAAPFRRILQPGGKQKKS